MSAGMQLIILCAIVAGLAGCGETKYRDVVVKQVDLYPGFNPYTVYVFEDDTKRVYRGMPKDVPAPGTRLRIADDSGSHF